MRIHETISERFVNFDSFAKLENVVKLSNSVAHKITRQKWVELKLDLFSFQEVPELFAVDEKVYE